MKLLEDKLEELDAYFAPKKESEKWLLIAGVAGIIGYIAYDFLLPYTEDLYNKSERSKQSIQIGIADNTKYLNFITVSGDREYYVKKFDKDIVRKKQQIVKLDDNIKFIDSNLEKLSDMLFNQKSWSKFLNSITHKAEIHNIGIQYIESEYVDHNGSFGHVLEIAVGTQGEFKNIVKFMNELEQNVLVTDIFKTELSLDENTSELHADIHISVWGINH